MFFYTIPRKLKENSFFSDVWIRYSSWVSRPQLLSPPTAAHIKYTGVSNEVILKNIEYLKSSGKQFVFRIPLIPDITDTDKNLKAISEIAGEYPVELLRYNTLAGAKYDYVGKQYKLGSEKNRDADFLGFFKNAKFG